MNDDDGDEPKEDVQKDDEDDDNVGNENGGRVLGGCSRLLSVCRLDRNEVVSDALQEIDGNAFNKLFSFPKEFESSSRDDIDSSLTTIFVGEIADSTVGGLDVDSNRVWLTHGPL